MNRLEKKCFIVSSALHGLLFAVVVFGSAFLVPSEKVIPVHPITVYSADMVTDALSSGGNPNVTVAPAPAPPAPQPAPPQPTPPPPQPDPPKAVKPIEPPKHHEEAVKPIEPPKRLSQNDLAPITKPDKTKSKLDPESLKPSVRKANDKVKPPKEQDDTAEREYKAAVAARQKAAAEFGKAFKTLSKNMSSSTVVEMPGPGGGGPVSANYRDLLFSKYYNAWNPPPGVDGFRDVLVSITIARDGSVLSARIIKHSGNAAIDKSVQNALDSVTFIEPFPAGSKEPERPFKIIFNPEAKRAIG
jgi:colicin import membrane protein